MIRISPGAYLKAVFNLMWSAIRHPRTTTLINLETGDIIEPQNHVPNDDSNTDSNTLPKEDSK